MVRFHLAFPVKNLEATRDFFCNILECTAGRTAERWIDFNFFGHQITAHLVNYDNSFEYTNTVDDKAVPTRHFGAILEWDQWQALVIRLRDFNAEFLIEPNIRFKGEVGEQATLFLKDPSGNALEFKSFKDQSQIFACSV